MSEKKLRTTTNQPGVYKNTSTGKYDVKCNYTWINPATAEKEYKAKWKYGINSYKKAVEVLADMKRSVQSCPQDVMITLKEAKQLWTRKALACEYSAVTIRNTEQQYNMITKFWSPELDLAVITEDVYLDLIMQCREYGYSEETIYNINACLRKLIKVAHKNRYLKENPIDYWDNPGIKTGIRSNVISYEEFRAIVKYFEEHEFIRLGENHYPKYVLLVNILYWTGMRIGEVLALQYSDFEHCRIKSGGRTIRMRVNVTKSYNSFYKLLKGTKNHKSRKIPLKDDVIEVFDEILKTHISKGGALDDHIFAWDHGACNVMIRKACVESGIKKYCCHDFRHTYISNLIRYGVPLPVIEAVSGDIQATILKHYSHMFKGDEALVLEALENV